MKLEQLDLLTSLFSGAPVSPSQSPESDLDWMTRVVTWPSTPLQWLTSCAPVGLFSRTCLASLVLEEDGTLVSSSQQWGNAGISAPGGFSMPNTSEWNHTLAPSLKDEGVCSLSDILETGDVPQRYFLSAKACSGILRRAANRGKELPPPLLEALKAVAAADMLDAGKKMT